VTKFIKIPNPNSLLDLYSAIELHLNTKLVSLDQFKDYTFQLSLLSIQCHAKISEFDDACIDQSYYLKAMLKNLPRQL